VKAARKLRARRNSAQGVWFGLGMMGLVGWSGSRFQRCLAPRWVFGWTNTIQANTPGRWRCWWPGLALAG